MPKSDGDGLTSGERKPKPLTHATWNAKVDHLHYMDQVTILTAGKTAEELFDCPFHEKAWRPDWWQICKLLERNGVLHERHLRLAQANTCARAILDRESKRVLRLVDWLSEHRHIDAGTFVTVIGAGG